VTYYSWFACPLLDLLADSRTRVRNGGAPLIPPRFLHLDLPKHDMRNVKAGFACELILLRWNPLSGAVEMATVTSVPVLLFKMRCVFFFTVKTCLCALSGERTLSFSFLSANTFLWRPLIFHMPRLVRLSLIFFLNGTIDSAISFRTFWNIFWQQTNQPNDLAGV